MPEKMNGDHYRSTIVCVDSYERRIMRGYLYNLAVPGAQPFEGLMQFLLKLEYTLSTTQSPQPFMKVRTYGPVQRTVAEGGEENTHLTGKQATFMVRVLFRQNASWQGIVTWLEGDRQEQFRSVLELAELMDSALDPKDSEI